MGRVFVGNLDYRVTSRELEDEFRTFGVVRSVWIARKPPGFAFIEFNDRRDAQDAICRLDGKNRWRVEMSNKSGSGDRTHDRSRDRYGASDSKCYKCGEPGHFARECSLCIGPDGLGSGRRRSRSPISRKSLGGYGRRSYSPLVRSLKRRSRSPPPRRQSRSRSPYRHNHENSPFANGYYGAGYRRRSRS